jgi:glycosyltransferase involved in cell wall biosynthesis
MKIALLHLGFTEYTIQLANGLSKYIDLTLIQPEKINKQCQDVLNPNINTIVFKKPSIRDPRNICAMGKLLKIIREINPDVLHVQESNDFWYDLTLLFNKFPPLVTTIHDIFKHPGDRDLIPGSKYHRSLALYRSQQIITHSHLLKQTLKNKFYIPENKINVLPHGELGSLFQNWAEQNRVKTEPYRLLFFSKFWLCKNLQYLLEAIALVEKKLPFVKLIIAGKGEDITKILSHYDLNCYEIINNYIPKEQVANLFQRSTAIILPDIESSANEVAMIAYSLGKPVIAADGGELGEIIHHKKDGLLVPNCDVQALADAIIKVLSDRQLQQQLRIGALTRCEQDLNWDNIAQDTIKVYEKVKDKR